ncbi:MAG: conserved membrane protein of unknown function [Promethearchaeota archaeon]|nr:MAG: conserved membrane protein of unknown function [Candidatus Lokiarchaeota archaeon]
MAFQDLSDLELIRGIFSLLFVVITVIIGIRIILKYFRSKNKTFITVGLAYIFLTSSWWQSAFNFLSLWLLDMPINTYATLFIVNGLIAPAILCWIYSFTMLLYENKKNEILIPFIIVFGAYEVLLIIFLFVEPSLVGTIGANYIVSRSVITLLFAIIAALIALITGSILSYDALRSTEPKIQWKGRFLLIAFIFFTIGAILDSFSWTSLFLVIFIKILLIISVISYYFGFFLPKKLANLLIKDV